MRRPPYRTVAIRHDTWQVCFPPLLGLELQSRPDGKPAMRTEGAVVVVALRPCVGRSRASSVAPELASRLATLTWVPDVGSGEGSSDSGGGAGSGGLCGGVRRCLSDWRVCGRVSSRRHKGALVFLSTPLLAVPAAGSNHWEHSTRHML